MPHIWSFSNNSKELLQQCINAAANIPQDDSNKWLQMFGPKSLDLLKKVDDSITIEDSPEMDISPLPQENQEEDISNTVEMLTDPDCDVVSKFDVLLEKCLNNPRILVKLAQNLPSNTIDKLTHYIFETIDINKDFLEHFYQYFLPALIKRENSRSCTELLKRAYKLHPQYFKIVLKSILKDLEVQNYVLNDFILTLDANIQSELVNNMLNIELSAEEFSHNLFNIYTAYKSCNKTDSIQNQVLSLLKGHSHHCTMDKMFGKLFLAFLQHEKNSRTSINLIEIESIIQIHRSPFTRPCVAILKEINDGNR